MFDPAASWASHGSTDRRFFPRFRVALRGICSVNRGPDIHCTSFDLSIANIGLLTIAKPNVGDTIIASFREFGMAKGRVGRLFEGGVVVSLDNVNPYRSRLSQYLVWLARGADRDVGQDRVHDRIVPLNRILTLTRADGRTSIGRVENVSRTGIAFTCLARVDVGEAVRVGRHSATIFRVFDDGAAAQFDSVLDMENFDVMISFAKPIN